MLSRATDQGLVVFTVDVDLPNGSMGLVAHNIHRYANVGDRFAICGNLRIVGILKPKDIGGLKGVGLGRLGRGDYH